FPGWRETKTQGEYLFGKHGNPPEGGLSKLGEVGQFHIKRRRTILKRSISTITLFMAVSFLFRVLTITLFGFTDPWTHRFFPTELATFLLGSVAYKMSSRPKNKEKNILFQYISFASIIFFLLTFRFIPLDDELKKIAFILLLSLTIGDIFFITKNSKIDTITGHLSYPIYVSHIFVTEYLLQKLHLPIPNGRFLNTLFVYSAVLLFSAVLYFTLEKPMNAFRRRFKNR
ncbi:acyltransferase family protein, partial [Nitratidesulfovibrio oxamicus]|uniref:acyltransferase family protein n=1 Tax=Nitratidesulfovibrio oxamicus TaxID=32016 RepID=UPI0035574282